MKTKSFIVYTAVNTVNDHRYIGVTSCGLPLRRRKHFQDARAKRRGCRVFNAAIRKYGESAFEWSILANEATFDLALKREIELIAKMRPEYNMTRGGQGMVGLARTPEWLAKVSAALKGRPPSPQCRAAMTWDHKLKSVICLNDGKFFRSVKDACAHYGIHKNNLWGMLAGNHARCAGRSFAFADAPLSSERCADLLKKIDRDRHAGMSRRKAKSVICLTTGIEYNSGREAASVHGISPSRVMQLCQGEGATATGLRFCYAVAP